MRTTLRIDDRLYREAKARAAQDGVTITRFLEEGIRLRLMPERTDSGRKHSFRVHEGGQSYCPSPEEIGRIANEEQEGHDLSKLDAPGGEE